MLTMAPTVTARAQALNERYSSTRYSWMAPHILINLVDDLGYYNVGWKNPDQPTPFLDKLVKEGTELMRHYTFRVCGPSRASLMTGRLPAHVSKRQPGS